MSHTVALRGFCTLNQYVDDVAAASAWYAEFLGVPAYFERSMPDGRLVYAEFRLGDDQDELGFIDRAFAPAGHSAALGGALMHWHVDDLEATLSRLLDMGAREHLPITEQAPGYVTASVVDPFGCILGVMSNEHFVEMHTR